MEPREPYCTARPGGYARIFAPDVIAAGSANDDALRRLAESMELKQIPFELLPAAVEIPAAYTYFGQFIDHDLTHEGVVHGHRGPEIRNLRMRPLTLESLYGAGPLPCSTDDLYEQDGASFRLGDPLPDSAGRLFDVPLGKAPCTNARIPIAADERNLENVIVRQLSVMFLLLHNLAVAELGSFEAARRRVTHQYQWLVRNDFLRTLCDSTIWEDVCSRGKTKIDWTGGFGIPLEFSRAAFRFGHSMVRQQYFVGFGRRDISDLFEYGATALSEREVVDWDRFFAQGGSREFAMRIDTSIITGLYKLPGNALWFFGESSGSDNKAKVLPRITLNRGVESKLPSGQAVREAWNLPTIEARPGYDPWKDLRAVDLHEQTPLWYYVLLEAEAQHGGGKLGAVGSHLVAETVEAALWSDRDSYLREYGRDWSPPPWPVEGTEGHTICSLADLAFVVGLAARPRSRC